MCCGAYTLAGDTDVVVVCPIGSASAAELSNGIGTRDQQVMHMSKLFVAGASSDIAQSNELDQEVEAFLQELGSL